jgi:hypothetical protein
VTVGGVCTRSVTALVNDTVADAALEVVSDELCELVGARGPEQKLERELRR